MAKNLTVTRNAETEFSVVSGVNTYQVAKADGRWRCSCPARGMCKHLRTVLSCFEMDISSTLDITPLTDSSQDSGLLSPEEFDAEAGRDVLAEIDYIRSGREKRNYGC
jgi:hypothetical protein